MSERHRTAWIVGTVLVLFVAFSATWLYLDHALSLLAR
jgi:hypothetical protein